MKKSLLVFFTVRWAFPHPHLSQLKIASIQVNTATAPFHSCHDTTGKINQVASSLPRIA